MNRWRGGGCARWSATSTGWSASARRPPATNKIDKDAASRLFVREGGRIVPLATGAIERLEACDDFVQIHSGGRCYRVNATLQELEARLDAACFVRVHRSHIVNLDHVV